jgi:CheY-like chemotaxis protein
MPAPDKFLLFVDDETTLVMLVKMTLKHRGIPVLTATSGEEALKLIEQDHTHSIKVVFTDINMGKVSGWELIERCREVRDDLRFMVLTAENDNTSQGARLVAEGKLFAYFDKISANQQEMFDKCAEAMVA